MKTTPEISALVERNRHFWKPETGDILWIYSGVNKVSVVGTGGLQKSSLCISNPYFNLKDRLFICSTQENIVKWGK